METTILGATGMHVSRICLGCMSYGTPSWRPWVLDEEAARPFFVRAIEAGINFFDTSDMYSLGVSEEVTGRLLREIGDLDQCVIATKVCFPAKPGRTTRALAQAHPASLRGFSPTPRRRHHRPLPAPSPRPPHPHGGDPCAPSTTWCARARCAISA